MILFFITIGQFIRAIWNGLRDPEFRTLLLLMIIMLLTGTFFYSKFEGWNLLDSLYFSVATLATVGYGDLAPTKPISKLFTIFYILGGIGILVGFFNILARNILKGNRSKVQPEMPSEDDLA